MPKLKRSLFSHSAAPPRIAKHRAEKIVHGVTLGDDYAWLKASNWQEVLRDPVGLPDDIRTVIEAENDYAQATLAPAAELRAMLVKEMHGRIKEGDREVPNEYGPWLYSRRDKLGGQHPVFCRVARSGGSEEVLLDGDVEGRGKSFFDLGAV